jgi:hypothetical protein
MIYQIYYAVKNLFVKAFPSGFAEKTGFRSLHLAGLDTKAVRFCYDMSLFCRILLTSLGVLQQ